MTNASPHAVQSPVATDEGLRIAPPPQVRAKYSSDPAPQPRKHVVSLRKDLVGYANYGAANGKADILYSGGKGQWRFPLDEAYQEASVSMALVLDDHNEFPASAYSIEVRLNGVMVYSGPLDVLQVPNGAPYGQRFQNWRVVTFPVYGHQVRSVQVDVANTSDLPARNWIAIDWIEVGQGSQADAVSLQSRTAPDQEAVKRAATPNPRADDTIEMELRTMARMGTMLAEIHDAQARTRILNWLSDKFIPQP